MTRSRKSDSPAGEQAKQQQMAGASSGPQEAQERARPENEKQPPQTSNRRGREHEHAPREGYAAGRQDEGEPSPESLKARSSTQGLAGGAGARGRAGGAETREAEAQSGEPREEHTRHGRQRTPGDRDPQQD
jgi:hypothetical protein